MIWVIILLAALMLVVAQRRWAGAALERLRVSGKADKVLVQPGETLQWTASVENIGRIPVLFTRLQLRFPTNTRFVSEKHWILDHCRQTLNHWYVEERLSVMPRRFVAITVGFSLPERGVYTVGDHRLSAGDLLGFREEAFEGLGGEIVVMPHLANSRHVVDAIGGFLGDISVQRFIMEDPILTAGFREYTGMEPMKSISWIRSAAAGSLQVKQYDHTAEHTVTVLLDTQGGTPHQIEACYRLMRTVCQILERRRIAFAMRTNGGLCGPMSKLFYLPEGLGENHLNTLLYALGKADYSCFFSPEYLTQQALKNRKKNESYILITPQLRENVAYCARRLREASGYTVCLLTGQEEVDAS